MCGSGLCLIALRPEGHVPEVETRATGTAADEDDDDDNDEDDYRNVASAAMWLHVAVSADLEKSQDRKCGSVGQEIKVEQALHQGSAEPHLVAMVTNRYG